MNFLLEIAEQMRLYFKSILKFFNHWTKSANNFGNIDLIDGQSINSADIFYLNSNSGYIKITGWTILPFFKKKFNEVFIKIGEKKIKVDFGLPRIDVAEYFENPALKFSGFSCFAPKEILHTGNNNIYLVVSSAKSKEIKVARFSINVSFLNDELNSFVESIHDKFDNYSSLCLLQSNNPVCSIFILNDCNGSDLGHCLLSLQKNISEIPSEIFLIKNFKDKGVSSNYKYFENLKVIETEEKSSPGKVLNQLVNFSKGSILFLISSNYALLPDSLSSIINTFNKIDNAGVISSKILNCDGRIIEAGISNESHDSISLIGFNKFANEYKYNYLREVCGASANSIAIRKESFIKISGFNENIKDYILLGLDLCCRLMDEGFKTLYQPLSQIIRISPNIKKSELNTSGISINCAANNHTSNSKKTILYIDHCIPRIDKDGASFITFQYFKAMKLIPDVKLILMAYDNNPLEPYTSQIQQLGIEVVYGEIEIENFIKMYGSEIDFSFVAQPYGSIKYIKELRKYSKAQILYMAHDIHFLRNSRGYYFNYGKRHEIEISKKNELDVMFESDITLLFSKDEVIYLKDNYPAIKSVKIPWIQEINVKSKKPDFSERDGLLFIGAFGHLPNIDAVDWFYHQIFSLVLEVIPDIKVTVLGSNPPEQIQKLNSSNFVVTGYLNDIDEYFINSRIFISPLRFGAGFKTKNARAMSYGLPVITTSIGAESMDVTDGINILTADDAPVFAAKIIELYNNEKLWNKLSVNSIKHISENYSFQNAQEFLEILLKNNNR